MEPGAGRLLGLLSVASVIRRVSLDFSDLFKQGLEFDSIEGVLRFNRGHMNTDRFLIISPAMKINISGRTGIVSRDYDQDIYVVPDLSDNLPLLSGLLGGPLVGGAVYLINRLTNIGEQINKTVTLHYKMTGSWGDHTIRFVDVPMANPLRLMPFPGQKADENINASPPP